MEQKLYARIVKRGDLLNDISNMNNDDFLAELWQGRIPGQTMVEENTEKYFINISWNTSPYFI